MNNRISKPRIDSDTLMVNEIFYSIQGESSHAGKPCVFVRLTYCNLRCSYCDTEYAFYEGTPMKISEVIKQVESHQCKTVEITGGEPLLQVSIFQMMSRLCDAGYTVLLETGGSRSIAAVDKRVIKIVDFKCPSSNMMHKNDYSNIDYLLPHDEVKFVMGNREDYEWSIHLLRETKLHQKVQTVLFSPVFGKIEPLEIVQWMLDDQIQKEIPNIRFQLQMHKFIWAPETRGV